MEWWRKKRGWDLEEEGKAGEQWRTEDRRRGENMSSEEERFSRF